MCLQVQLFQNVDGNNKLGSKLDFPNILGIFFFVKESFHKVWSSIKMFIEMVRFKYFLKLPRALQMTTASRATRMSFTIATN